MFLLQFDQEYVIIKISRKEVSDLKKHKVYLIVPAVVIVFGVIMNILAISSRKFADFYVSRIFPVITNTFSFISGIFPFSVGEIMIIIGIILVLIGVPAVILLLIFGKKLRRRVAVISSAVLLWIVAFIFITETMNCFIMYRCTPFSEKYFTSREHPREELTQLYAYLIDKTNELADQVPRDSDDRFFVTADVNKEAKAAMKRAAERYPQLKGYYPDAKPIMFSFFMSQTDLSGIYFPFSLEANYNDDMVRTNLPDTVCHEYSHLKGIIQEDEANFISFIAATGSDDPEFRYSGYLEALEYVHNQVYDNNISVAYGLTDTISSRVRSDWFRFLPDDYWEVNKDKEIISTETVSTFSENAIDTNIKLNGREEGIEAYSHMVDLLLDYYFPEGGFDSHE